MDIFDLVVEIGYVVGRRFPTINSGGCCVYAAKMAEELEKRGYAVSAWVAMDEWAGSPDLGGVRLKVKHKRDPFEWNDNGVDFMHVGFSIRHNGTWRNFDTEGEHVVYVMNGWKILKGRLTAEEAKGMARRASYWNKTWDRRLNRDVRSLIETMFKEWEASNGQASTASDEELLAQIYA